MSEILQLFLSLFLENSPLLDADKHYYRQLSRKRIIHFSTISQSFDISSITNFDGCGKTNLRTMFIKGSVEKVFQVLQRAYLCRLIKGPKYKFES